jgi:hypothetical protein
MTCLAKLTRNRDLRGRIPGDSDFLRLEVPSSPHQNFNSEHATLDLPAFSPSFPQPPVPHSFFLSHELLFRGNCTLRLTNFVLPLLSRSHLVLASHLLTLLPSPHLEDKNRKTVPFRSSKARPTTNPTYCACPTLAHLLSTAYDFSPNMHRPRPPCRSSTLPLRPQDLMTMTLPITLSMTAALPMTTDTDNDTGRGYCR